MGHLTYGYKLNERGRMIYRTFDSDALHHGYAKDEGWYDSPAKVPGSKEAMAAEAAAKAATAHTTAAEPARAPAPIGEKRGPGRPRKNP